MKTIEQCKQEIAEKHKQTSWKEFIWNHFSGDLTPRAINLLWEEVCELYADQFRQPEAVKSVCEDEEKCDCGGKLEVTYWCKYCDKDY